MATKYAWRGSAGLMGDDTTAQMVGERLAQIEHERGALTPEAVVEDAADSNSPLNRYFEWDNSEAAERYRLYQARILISRVHVRMVGDKEVKEPVRAFINLLGDGDEGRHYENVVSAMTDKGKREAILARARKELAEWSKRYRELEEFAAVHQFVSARRPASKPARGGRRAAQSRSVTV